MEPGAGSDLAALGTRAIKDGGGEGVTGQKVWTSMEGRAGGLLVARTDPDVPGHQGITYFIVDMTDLGVEVRLLRQLTGEAEFSEVFLTEVPIPADRLIGAVGDGWRVAQTTLMHERVAIGGGAPREGGAIGLLAKPWRNNPSSAPRGCTTPCCAPGWMRRRYA